MSTPVPQATRDSLPQVAIALVIAAFVLLHTWEDLQRSFGSEYYQNWVVAQEIHTTNARQMYSAQWQQDIGQKYWLISHSDRATKNQLVASDAHRTLDAHSTPLVYSAINLLSTSSYAQSLQIFRVIQFSCGILAILLLCRLLDFSWTATILAVTVLWGWGQPFLADIFAADISQILLLLVTLLLWVEMQAKQRLQDFAAGVLLAVIILLQPELITIPMVLLAVLPKGRLQRHLIASVIAAIALITFSVFKFGSAHCWFDWIETMREVWTSHPPVSANNASLMEILREHLGIIASNALAIAMLIGTFALIRLAAKQRVQSIYALIAIGIALPLLVLPITWQTNFVLAVPALLFAFRPTEDHINRVIFRWSLGAIALLLFCTSYLTTNILWLDDPQGIAARLAGSTLAFFCLAIAQLRPLTSTAPASHSATSET